MPIHVTLDEDEEEVSSALPYVDRADVCSTCFTLARSPGMHLTALLTRLPCRNRRVLCVRDWSRIQRDEHDISVLASESYNELREIQWSSYRFCLPILPDLLSLTPRLQRLTVEALDDPESPIDDAVPECPPLRPEEAYTFSLTSLECSAVLSAEVLSRILACSTQTLRHMYLLIHAAEFDKLAAAAPELPALRSLAVLQADGLGDRGLIARFLRRCPRLTELTVATEDPGASDGVQIWAPASPRLRALTVYATYRYWSARCTQMFRRALQHWSRLRRLELVVNANGCSSEEEAALRRVCSDVRIALHVVRLARPRFPAGWRLPGVVPATYGDYPRV